MARILKTAKSSEDYEAIEEFIAKDSPQNAEEIIRRFEERLEFLARNRFLGLPRPELAPDLRSWPVHRYLLYYRPIADGLILVRVLHGSMDITPKNFRYR